MLYSPIAILVVLAWFPAVLYIFQRFPPQRALVISFIAGWLFLPTIQFTLPGIPDATCYSILLATVIYDIGRITSFKLGWLDIPMLIWCLCPFASSVSNDLGVYDGLSSALDQIMTWGVPYFLGRIYLGNLAGIGELAKGIFIGGLIYIPFCLFETRMSTNLHQMVYGFADGRTSFLMSIRFGGYRPSVFMESGLMLGVWMMTATLIGIWFWKTGTMKQVRGFAISWVVVLLLITFILVKATGAYLLLLIGLVFLFTGKWLRTAMPVFIFIAGMCYYQYMGVVGIVPIDQVEQISLQVTNEERTQSLIFRLDNEVLLAKKARERIIFGWGGFGRNRIYAPDWKGDIVDISVTDSLWIIAFGSRGLVGLISLNATLLLPVVSIFATRYPAGYWSHPKVGPVAVLAICLSLYALDCIVNAMTNPIFALISGGLSGLVLQERKTKQMAKSRPVLSRKPLTQSRQN
jgi:hypothetical protein